MNNSKTTKQVAVIKQKKGALSGIFNSLVGEKRELSKYWKIVKKIEALEPEMQKLSDIELKAKTLEFRERLGDSEGAELQKKLKDILPEAFAVVREGAWRSVGMKHFAVQLIGGMVLNDGRIAEMKTGEGKTLVATLFVYLNALPVKHQVHVVTVNDYLARRDASWMGQIYDFLGLTIGVIQNQSSFYFKLGHEADERSKKLRNIGQAESLENGQDEKESVLDVENLVATDRKRAYWDGENDKTVDIVYGVNSEFGFDYLRDNMAQSPSDVVQKAGHHSSIVDEVDSILIDEARTPLIISSQDSEPSDNYRTFSKIVSGLNKDIDYTVDEKRKVVTLLDDGIKKVEQALGIPGLYASAENVVLIHHLDQALKAKAVFNREKEYVVKGGEIIIVDENTGRMMVGRRYNQGLHQAIEAKEGLEIKTENKTVASITFQNYFRLYKKLSGMTGTAATESEELFKIYKLLVVSIPTNRPMVRKNFVDQIFKSEMGKFEAIVRDIGRIHATGQPILVGTTSIEKNLLLCQLLDNARLPYEVLNAKNHEQEARIISGAGKKGAITIATNIAGRGVDIKLGGEKPESTDTAAVEKWKLAHEEVKSLGGLHVIGTERHESRRIDNQLRGRSGRQGDPGSARFFISLEDYLIRVFGGDRTSVFKMLPIADSEAIESKLLSGLIEGAQKKIESQNYDMRKHVTDYDDVINKQRTVIYGNRNKALIGEGFDWKYEISKSLFNEIERCLRELSPRLKKKNLAKQLSAVSENLKQITDADYFAEESIIKLLKSKKWNYKKTALELAKKAEGALMSKWGIYQEHVKSALSRYVVLRSIDLLWQEHLVTIDHLNDSVRLRSYSQKDPLSEFKHDGMRLFQLLIAEIDKEIATTLFKVTPELVPTGIMK
jgi:preprotein translocase subunit SecA